MRVRVMVFWALLMLLGGCQQEKVNASLDVVVLRDVTHQKAFEISSEDIETMLQIDQHIWQPASVTLRRICEVEECTVQTAHIGQGDSYRQSEIERKRELVLFLESLRSMFIDDGFTQRELVRSYVYYAIAEELQVLAQSTAHRRVLLIESDLLENSSYFSVYITEGVALLRENPDSLENLLSKYAPLPEDLSGIEVQIVYRANEADYEMFALMSRFYRKVLSSRGAKVEVRANF